MPAIELTRGELGAWLKLGPQQEVDAAILDTICAATTAFVNDLPHVRADQATQWAAGTRAGALMLAARLWRRRNSPEGVASFAEAGVSFVARYDPDVTRLLRLNGPRVG